MSPDLTIPVTVHFDSVRPKSPVLAKVWAKALKPRFTHTAIQVGPIMVSLASQGKTNFVRIEDYFQERGPTVSLYLREASATLVAQAMIEVSEWTLSTLGSLWAYAGDRTYVPQNCATLVSAFLTRVGYPVYGLTPDHLYSELVWRTQ